jgi:hypothetical protein
LTLLRLAVLQVVKGSNPDSESESDEEEGVQGDVFQQAAAAAAAAAAEAAAAEAVQVGHQPSLAQNRILTLCARMQLQLVVVDLMRQLAFVADDRASLLSTS